MGLKTSAVICSGKRHDRGFSKDKGKGMKDKGRARGGEKCRVRGSSKEEKASS